MIGGLVRPRAARMTPDALERSVARRLFDIAIASTALVLLLPLIAILALAIKLESPGPVFYRCRRVGMGGRELLMLKFRKMRGSASGLPLTVDEDERFTRIGRVLARTKLDELPQLWNVLNGGMSFVGPRPEDRRFVELRPTDYALILQVKPGITGLSQLAFAREGEILDVRDPVRDYIVRLLPAKTAIDRLYVVRRSVPVDLRILLWTAVAVLFRSQVAVDRSTARLTLRRRPTALSPETLSPETLEAQEVVS